MIINNHASTFAKYKEFDYDIGMGQNFCLRNYYLLCDTIIEALREHVGLIAAYKELIGGKEEYYQDDSLHLMAFDLMYCFRCYNFYNGLEYQTKSDRAKKQKQNQVLDNEQKELDEKIAVLKTEIHELELSLDEYSDISVLGVDVFHDQYGKGKVISQNADVINRVTVKFDTVEKDFFISNKYHNLPHFEDNEKIVAGFSKYEHILAQLKKARNELSKLV